MILSLVAKHSFIVSYTGSAGKDKGQAGFVPLAFGCILWTLFPSAYSTRRGEPPAVPDPVMREAGGGLGANDDRNVLENSYWSARN